MPVFPTQGWPNGPVINPWCAESMVLGTTKASGLLLPTVAGTRAALQVLYVPFHIFDRPWTAKRLFIANGATVNGNLDVGIYDQFGNRLVSSGSTVMAGASVTQWLDTTDTTLQPGMYYLAFVTDSATATFLRATPSIAMMRAVGCRQETLAAMPLPATATFGAVSAGLVQLFGASSRTI